MPVGVGAGIEPAGGADHVLEVEHSKPERKKVGKMPGRCVAREVRASIDEAPMRPRAPVGASFKLS